MMKKKVGMIHPTAGLFLGFFLFLTSAWSAGPILIDNETTGVPVMFQGGNVTFNPETSDGNAAAGKLGRLTNEEAIALVVELFDDWKNVTLAGVTVGSLKVTQGKGLGNVDQTNVKNHFSYCPPGNSCPDESSPFVTGSARSGQSPIIFDEEGSITDLIQGQGASNDVLGFAGPRLVERVNGVLYITESQAVLNGKFINCPTGAAAKDACQTPEVTVAAFKGAIFHELGHFLGLDHVQLNLASANKLLAGDATEASAIPTMLPLYVDGQEQLTPHTDDIVSLAMLYPSSTFPDSFCSIQGTVYESDGTTEFQGVNVIARNVANGLNESVSFVSGAFYTGSATSCNAKQGAYSLLGIVPAQNYSLEIEKISSTFTGGSSIEPCDPPAGGYYGQKVDGTFACSKGGEVIKGGSVTTTNIVTSKKSSTTSGGGGSSDDGGGGCSLILFDEAPSLR